MWSPIRARSSAPEAISGPTGGATPIRTTPAPSAAKAARPTSSNSNHSSKKSRLRASSRYERRHEREERQEKGRGRGVDLCGPRGDPAAEQTQEGGQEGQTRHQDRFRSGGKRRSRAGGVVGRLFAVDGTGSRAALARPQRRDGDRHQRRQ